MALQKADARTGTPVDLTVQDIQDIKSKLNLDNIDNQSFSEIENTVNSISAGEGGVIYDTLLAAQAVSPKPSDGTIFQVSEITDSANAGFYSFQSSESNGTRFEKPFEKIKYPFKDDGIARATSLKNTIDDFILDVKVNDASISGKEYAINRIKKNDGGVWEIRLSIETLIVDSIPSDFSNIGEFQTQNNPEIGDRVTVHKLDNINASVAVNWYKIPDGSHTNMWAGLGYALDSKIFNRNFDPYHINLASEISSLSVYPFKGLSTNLDSNILKAIKDIQIFGYTGTKKLYIGKTEGGEGSSALVRLFAINADGTGLEIVCQFKGDAQFVKKTGLQKIESNGVFGSFDVKFIAYVDWSEIPTIDTLYTYSETSLSERTWNTNDAKALEKTKAETTENDALITSKSSSKQQEYINRVQKITGDYNNIMVYGQSLAGGNNAYPINTTSYKNSKMIGDDPLFRSASDTANLYDLVTGTSREPLGIQATHAFKDLIDNYLHNISDKQFVTTTNARGGTSIEHLSKNNPVTDYYEDEFLASLNAMKAIADAESKTVSCPVIVWAQGEANMTEKANQSFDGTSPATSDKDTYKAYLETLVQDMTADVKLVYGQEYDPIILMYVTRNTAGGIDAGVQMAQIEFCNENYNAFIFTPTYFLITGNDATHPRSNGYRWMGEYLSKSLHKAILHEKKPQILQPSKIEIHEDGHGDNYVDVHFNVPVPPLQKNTETYPVVQRNTIDTLGFGVYDDGVEARISSVELFNSFARIRIYSSFRFTSNNITVTYADSNVGLNASGSGNLCDSDDFKAKGIFITQPDDTRIPNYLDGTSIENGLYPMYNWCPSFSYTLNGVDELDIEF